MASPNGYFDCGPFTPLSRNAFRANVAYNLSNPPWDQNNLNLANFYFTVEYGTSSSGPWSAAPLQNNLIDLCSGLKPNNRLSVGNHDVQVGSLTTVVHNTNYYIRWTLFDNNNVQLDQLVCGPNHTQDRPTFSCAVTSDPTQTSADVLQGGATGQLNIQPCNNDQVVWEIATSPGGPFTATAPADVVSYSPAHTFTGLSPGTKYYWRSRFSEISETGTEYLVTPVCNFTTDIPPPTLSCAPVTSLTQEQAKLHGSLDADGFANVGETIAFEWGDTPGGPYPNKTPDVPVTGPTQLLSQLITGLKSDTNYYYKVFSKNKKGEVTAESSECTFKTPQWFLKGFC